MDSAKPKTKQARLPFHPISKTPLKRHLSESADTPPSKSPRPDSENIFPNHEKLSLKKKTECIIIDEPSNGPTVSPIEKVDNVQVDNIPVSASEVECNNSSSENVSSTNVTKQEFNDENIGESASNEANESAESPIEKVDNVQVDSVPASEVECGNSSGPETVSPTNVTKQESNDEKIEESASNESILDKSTISDVSELDKTVPSEISFASQSSVDEDDPSEKSTLDESAADDNAEKTEAASDATVENSSVKTTRKRKSLTDGSLKVIQAKLTEKEKEEKRKQREALLAEKAAAKAKREAERQAKLEAREKAKQEKQKKLEELRLKKEEEQKKKEEERVKKEEEKAKREEERARKEQEKKDKQAQLEKEKEEKERERLRKEEEKQRILDEKRRAEEQELAKKKRISQKFLGFFKKADTSQQPKKEVLQAVTSLFRPFELKKDMSLANIVPKASRDRFDKTAFEKVFNEQWEDATTYLSDLRQSCYTPYRFKRTLNVAEDEDSTDDVIVVNDIQVSSTKFKIRPKLFQFCENYRPPYWGTWRKRCEGISGRRPFGKYEPFDYEVDSDDEWEEEEEGESLNGTDNEEEDKEENEEGMMEDDEDGFLVPHGHLSDDEGNDEDDDDDDLSPEGKKARLRACQEAFLAERRCTQPKKLKTVVTVLNEDLPETIALLESFKAVFLAEIPLPPSWSIKTVDSPNEKDSSELPSTPKGPRRLPEEVMPAVLEAVHGYVGNREDLVEAVKARLSQQQQQLPNSAVDGATTVTTAAGPQSTFSADILKQCSKQSIKITVREVCRQHRLSSEENKFVFVVNPAVLSKHGMKGLTLPAHLCKQIPATADDVEGSPTVSTNVLDPGLFKKSLLPHDAIPELIEFVHGVSASAPNIIRSYLESLNERDDLDQTRSPQQSSPQTGAKHWGRPTQFRFSRRQVLDTLRDIAQWNHKRRQWLVHESVLTKFDKLHLLEKTKEAPLPVVPPAEIESPLPVKSGPVPHVDTPRPPKIITPSNKITKFLVKPKQEPTTEKSDAVIEPPPTKKRVALTTLSKTPMTKFSLKDAESPIVEKLSETFGDFDSASFGAENTDGEKTDTAKVPADAPVCS